MRVFEVTTKSDKLLFYDPDDMESFMREENDIESLEDTDTPIQFDIHKDIEAIKRLKPGMTWRHALATIRYIDD